MKQLSMSSMERLPRHGWRFKFIASVILCAGFAVPSSSSAGGANGETVGTLPHTSGQGGGIDGLRSFRDSKPALYLEAPIEQISETVLGWSGRAVVSEEVVDVSTHVVRLTFHGDLRLELDRHLFEQGRIKIGWTVPRAFGPGRTTLFLGDRTIASGIVTARSWSLPVLAMESSGSLDIAPFSIVTSGHLGRATLDITANDDELVLSQTR